MAHYIMKLVARRRPLATARNTDWASAMALLCCFPGIIIVSVVIPPPGYVAIPELSDEFDGAALDRSKWSTDRKVVGWSGKKPGLFDPSNVVVRDGMLQLFAMPGTRNESWPAGFDNYTTSAVHSLARVREGFFEVRWRSGSSGISSSWWLHQTTSDAWTEIDVFETTGATNGHLSNASNLPSHIHIFKLPNASSSELPGRCQCKLHHSGGGQPRCSVGSTVNPLPGEQTFASAFHVASLNWTSSGVTIEIDGKVVNRLASPCLVQEIGIDLDRETMPGWMALPPPKTLPDTPFMIDYVRAWRRSAPPPPAPAARSYLLNVGLPANVNLTVPASVTAGRVALLTTWFGSYPCIGCGPQKTRWCNGGLPQLANLSLHRQAMERDMGISVPDEEFDGYIVHDYEAWAAPWGRASELYRNASIALAASQLPAGSSSSAIAARAEEDYDHAAIAFLSFTINVTKQLRPKAAGVGFYAYPAHSYFGNATEQARLNDQLLPLWKAQTAFFPSLYLPYGTRPECTGTGCSSKTKQEAYIDGGVRESVRVADLAGGSKSTLPYAWYRYHDGEPKGLQLLNATDASLEFVRPFTVGGAHVPSIIIWGSEHNATEARNLESWFGKQSAIFGDGRGGTAESSPPHVTLKSVGLAPATQTSSFRFPRTAAVIPPFTRCGL